MKGPEIEVHLDVLRAAGQLPVQCSSPKGEVGNGAIAGWGVSIKSWFLEMEPDNYRLSSILPSCREALTT